MDTTHRAISFVQSSVEGHGDELVLPPSFSRYEIWAQRCMKCVQAIIALQTRKTIRCQFGGKARG